MPSFFESLLSSSPTEGGGELYNPSTQTSYMPEYGQGSYSGADNYTPGAVTGYRGYSFDPMRDAGKPTSRLLGTPFDRFDAQGNQTGSDTWTDQNSGVRGDIFTNNPGIGIASILAAPFAMSGLQGLFASGGALGGEGAGAGFLGDATAAGYDPLFGASGAGGGGGAAGVGASAAGGAGGGGFAPAASEGAFNSALAGQGPMSIWDKLSSGIGNLFSSGGAGGGGSGLGAGIQGALKFGTPLMQILAGLEGRKQASSLQKQMQLPNPSDVTGIPGYQAGLEAVRRSMASQGFTGSGNMMAALAKYGGDFYNQYADQRLKSAQAQGGPAGGGISGMALLAQGINGLGRAF